MAARAAGRVDEAIDHFASARKANERARERLLTPQLCCELARSLIERGLPGDLERAHAEIEHGLAIAQSRGMKRHVEKLLKLRLDAEGVGPITNEGSIFVVARSVRSDRPDLTRAAAPDGTVTIMFSDIQDSTVLTDRLGDNRWMELLGDHNAIVTSAVDSHGGYEVKAQGDGYMIAFDSGRRALKCAVDIQRNLARYRAAHPESPLHVRIGLHTGEVIRDQDDFFGRNVILAARIASSAAGDEILASSVVRELTISSGEVEFGEFREVELKGLSGLHRVHAVPY
jgi:class 3 adenylate cyclase